MAVQTHRINAFFSLDIEPPSGIENSDALTLRLRVRPVVTPQTGDLVSLSQVRQLGWPLTVRSEIPTAAPAGGTYHDEGYTDHGWTGGDDFEKMIAGLNRPVSGDLSVFADFSAETITVHARSQQLAVAGARLELARAGYALGRFDQANGWTYHWPMADVALTAIALGPAGDGALPADATFWAAIVVQDAPITLPNGLTQLGPICAIQSDRPDYLARLNLTWSLTPAAAQRADLQPLMGGHPNSLRPIAPSSAAGQAQWSRDGNHILVRGVTSAAYSLAGA